MHSRDSTGQKPEHAQSPEGRSRRETAAQRPGDPPDELRPTN